MIGLAEHQKRIIVCNLSKYSCGCKRCAITDTDSTGKALVSKDVFLSCSGNSVIDAMEQTWNAAIVHHTVQDIVGEILGVVFCLQMCVDSFFSAHFP